MSKVTLATVGSLTQNPTTAQTTINNNFSTIQTSFDNTISRDGTQPNQMNATLDMNSNQIINLPAPGTINSPARLIDVTSNPTIVVPATGTSGHTVPFLDGNNTWSGTNTWNASSAFNTTATFAGPTTLSGATTISGTPTLATNLTLSGTPTISGNFSATGNINSSGVNTWTNTNTFSGNVNFTGTVTGIALNVPNSVKNFGAKGDGVTDDRAAIQAAINALPAAGGTLYFPTGIYQLNSAFNSTTVLNITSPVHIIGETGTWLRPTSSITNAQSIITFNGVSATNQPSTIVENIGIGDPGLTVRFGNHGMVFVTPPGTLFKQPIVRNCKIIAANLGTLAPVSTTPTGCAIYVNNDPTNTTGGFVWSTIEQCTLAGGVYYGNAGDSNTLRDCIFPPNVSDANACNFGVYVNLIAGAGNFVMDKCNLQCNGGMFYIDNCQSATIRDCTVEQIAPFIGARSTMCEVGISSINSSGNCTVEIVGGSYISNDNTNVPYLIGMNKAIGCTLDHVRLGHNFSSYPHALVNMQAGTTNCVFGAGIWWEKAGGVTITTTAEKYNNSGTNNVVVTTAAA